MKQVRIRWSDVPTYAPIELTIPGIAICKPYFFNKFYLFKDCIINLTINKNKPNMKTCELIIPKSQYETAIWLMPVKIKQQFKTSPCKIKFVKISLGRMRILKMEKGD